MRAVAMIPAKSISRRLPGKNLKPLSGMPLFLHSVHAAMESGVFDAVYVSSDAEEILALTQQAGATALARAPDLCEDAVTNFQVLRHHVTQWRVENRAPDFIALLQPTTPFRTPQALAAMLARLVADAEADSLVTVTRASRLRGVMEAGCWRPAGEAWADAGRIQAKHEYFEFTGHAVMLKPAQTLDQGSLLGNRILAEPLPAEWPDIDIDTPQDWRMAQAYAQFMALPTGPDREVRA